MRQERIANTVTINGKRYVCRIYDFGGGDNDPLDRYTIAYKGYYVPGYGYTYPYRACSDRPFHEFGLYCESKQFLDGKHLGKRVRFESLPADVKKLIIQDLTGNQ